MSFNKLTPAEVERLALLAEECAEVIQAVTKILRHGYEGHNTHNVPEFINRKMLEMELGHVMFALRFMRNNQDIDVLAVERAADEKAARISRWLRHNEVTA